MRNIELDFTGVANARLMGGKLGLLAREVELIPLWGGEVAENWSLGLLFD